MKLLHDRISPLIESQFPSFYAEEGPLFITFVKEYYKWLEQEDNALHHSRRLLDYGDVDYTITEFLPHFQNKYLIGTPTNNIANQRDLIKHARDIYASKGTIESLRLIFQMLFQQEIEVYYPGDDILRTSDGIWIVPQYLEVSISDRTKGFIGKQILGSVSGATAFVERVDRRTYQGHVVDLLYLSNILRNDVTGASFIYGELVADTDTVANAPRIVGSLTRVGITSAGAGYTPGQIVDIVSSRSGIEGRARVVEVGNRTGEVNYVLYDGGYGYTLTSNCVVSANVISLTDFRSRDNTSAFLEFSTLVQPLTNVIVSSANTTFAADDLVYGTNSINGVITAGFVVTANNTSGQLLLSPHSVSKINIGSITVANTSTGSFVLGETVYQTNSTGNAAVGIIVQANSTYTIVDQYVGPFISGQIILSKNYPTTANAVSVTSYAYESNNFSNTSVTKILKGETLSGAVKSSAVGRTQSANVIGANTTAVGVYPLILSGVTIINTAGGFSCDSASLFHNQTITLTGTNSNTGNVYVTLTNVSATNTSGGFTCDTPTHINLTPNQLVKVSGTNIGTGTISGFSNPTTYKISIVPTANTFRLTTVADAAITTTAGTLTYNFGIDLTTQNSLTYKISATNESNTFTLQTASGGSLTSVVGIPVGWTYTLSQSFTSSAKAWVYSPNNQSTSLTTFVSTGYPGGFKVGAVTDTEQIVLSNVLISSANSSGGLYTGLTINAANYGFPANTTSGYTSVIATTFNRQPYTIGRILSLTERNPGFNNTAKPFDIEIEKNIAAYYKRDTIVCDINTGVGGFSVGELITQSVSLPRATLGVSSVTGTFNAPYREYVQQVRSDGVTVYGELYSAGVTSGTGSLSLYVANTANTFNTSNTVVGLLSGATGSVSNVATGTVNVNARGTVLLADPASVTIKRTSFQDFVRGYLLVGAQSGSTANCVTVTPDASSLPLGKNANIDPITGLANGTISTVEVVTSGVFYEPGETVIIQVDGNQATGAGIAYVESVGVDEGYFKTNQGLISSSNKIQDNYYYQEYSYEIRSGVDRDTYEPALKSLTHVSGTKLFNKYLKSSAVPNIITKVTPTDTTIARLNTSPGMGTFTIGETVYQSNGTANTATGVVLAASTSINRLEIAVSSGQFISSNTVTGITSLASATTSSVTLMLL